MQNIAELCEKICASAKNTMFRLTAALSVCGILVTYAVAQVDGTFIATGSMHAARNQPSATLLNDGRVVVFGQLYGQDLPTGELYNPSAGEFALTQAAINPIADSAATLLSDGRVLLLDDKGFAELFDPATGTFQMTIGNPVTPIFSPHAVRLSSGKVLFVGGYTNNTSTLSPIHPEIYDPSTGTFSETSGNLLFDHGIDGFTATLLPSGKVLIAGGVNVSGAISDTELYDPISGSFIPAAKMLDAHTFHSATLLQNGKVLIVGGAALNFTSELYDPSTDKFSPSGVLHTFRQTQTATLLANGNVLLVGGGPGAEVYDSQTGRFSQIISTVTSRFHLRNAASILQNGNVLVVGGLDDSNNATASAELFVPAEIGTILVTTNLAQATFTIYGDNGRAFQGSGVLFSVPAPIGTYAIRYGGVLGYVTPPQSSAALRSGEDISFSGTYLTATSPPPSINRITPNNLTLGQTIPNFTVNGNDFQPGAQLSFGGTGLTINSYVSVSSTDIVANVSVARDAPLSVQSVSVINRDGQSATLTIGVTVRHRPVIVIPGILGSVLERSDNGQVVWLNAQDALGGPNPDNRCDSFLLPLALDKDGQTSASAISINCGASIIKASGTAMRAIDLINSFLTDRVFYGPLLDSLSDFPLAPFPYDWRLDYRSIAPRLRDLIVSLAPNPWDRVDIVAHSQGGLIARTYLGMLHTGQLGSQIAASDTRIDTIVYLGTPHLGAASSYTTLLKSNLLQRYYGDPFEFGPAGIIALNTQTMFAISENFASLYDLLPQYNFYSVDGQFQPFQTTYNASATALPNSALTNAAQVLWNTTLDSGLQETSHVYAVNGSGQNTLRALINLQGTDCIVPGNDPLGDGTVPFISSSAGVGTENIFVNAKHADLPSDHLVQAIVRQLLNGTDLAGVFSQTGVSKLPFSSGKNLTGYTCSPVLMNISNNQGDIDGVGSDNNMRVQIANSDFLHFPSTEATLLADNQKYAVSLSATAAGTFTLVFDRYDSTLKTSSLRFDHVPISRASKGHLTLDPTSSSAVLSVDVKGDGTTIFSVNANQPPPLDSFALVLADVLLQSHLPHRIDEELQGRIDEILKQFQMQHTCNVLEGIAGLKHRIVMLEGRHAIASSAAGPLFQLMNQALSTSTDCDRGEE